MKFKLDENIGQRGIDSPKHIHLVIAQTTALAPQSYNSNYSAVYHLQASAQSPLRESQMF